jgi:hypothetical protein
MVTGVPKAESTGSTLRVPSVSDLREICVLHMPERRVLRLSCLADRLGVQPNRLPESYVPGADGLARVG